MTMAWIGLMAVGGLGSLAAFVWLLVIAFRESTAWGLASLFIPFAALVFVLKFWDQAKLPFFGCLAGSALGLFAAVGYSMTSVNIGIEEYADLGEKVAWESPTVESLPDIEFEAESDVQVEDLGPDQTSEMVDELMESASDLRTTDHEDALEALDDTGAPRPQPRAHRDGTLVPVTTLGSFQEERIVLILKSLERVSAYVISVDEDSVKLRHRVGGGSVIYSIDFDDIKEVRSRRTP